MFFNFSVITDTTVHLQNCKVLLLPVAIIFPSSSYYSVISPKFPKMKILFLLLLILFEAKGQNVFKLRLPKEVHDFRDLEKESSFCTTIEINHPIYIYQFDPVLNEETNHISVVSVSPILENTENSPKTKENMRGFTECTNLGIIYYDQIMHRWAKNEKKYCNKYHISAHCLTK